MTYTALSVVGVLAAVVLDVLVLRTRLVLGRAFWLTYAIVLVGQLVTNGLLTGQRIVRYHSSAILGGASVVAFGDWRVAWAPVEDLLFGFSLVLQTVAWWVFWGARLSRPTSPDQRRPGDRDASA